MDIVSEFISVWRVESGNKIYEKHFIFIVLLELVCYIVQKYDPVVISKIIPLVSKILLVSLEYNSKIYLTVMFLLMQIYSFYSYDTYIKNTDNKIFVIFLFYTRTPYYILKTILINFFVRCLIFTKDKNIHQICIMVFLVSSYYLDEYFEKN